MNYKNFAYKEKMAAENGMSKEYNDCIFVILKKEEELIELLKDPVHISSEYQDMLLKLSFTKMKIDDADKLLSENSSMDARTLQEQRVILGQIKIRIYAMENTVNRLAEKSQLINKLNDASKKQKLLDFASKL